jgi:alpha-1,2-mannosyltransferase
LPHPPAAILSDTPAESAWTARRLTLWGTGLLVLSWFIYIHTMMVPGLVDRAGRFKGTDHIYFYVMGSLMLDGRSADLYSPDAHLAEGRRRIDANLALYAPHSNYGPQVALAFTPLARLSYGWSLTIFLTLSVICYAASVWLVWRDLPGLAAYGQPAWVLAAASPLLFTLLRYAQLSAFTLLLIAAALSALRRNRRFLAGAALGLLVFKPQLGAVLGIALLMGSEWRVVAGAAATGIAQISIAWLVSTTAIMRQYVEVLWRLLRDPTLVQIHPTEVHSLRGFLQLLTPDSTAVSTLGPILLVALLLVGVKVWRSRGDLEIRWGTLIVLTVLASPHLLTYDLILLTVPLLTFANWAVTHRDHALHRWASLSLLLVYLAPFSSNLARLWPVQVSVLAIATVGAVGAALCRQANASSSDRRGAAACPRLVSAQ